MLTIVTISKIDVTSISAKPRKEDKCWAEPNSFLMGRKADESWSSGKKKEKKLQDHTFPSHTAR